MIRPFLFVVLATPLAAQDIPILDASHFGKVVVQDAQSGLGAIRHEALIGAQNIEFISSYGPDSPFAFLGRAVGKLDILTDTNKYAPCTAFLISENRLITNYHCVPGVLEHPQIGGSAIAAIQFHAGFIQDGVRADTQSFHVSPVPIESSKELDYSVLQVLGDANAEFGALELSNEVPKALTPFWVIGHPLGEAQRISREKCQASAPALSDNRILHTCDTMPGSSGSPVIDTGNQRVVALHHASAGSVNLAIPMQRILASSSVLKSNENAGSETDTGILKAELAQLQQEVALLRIERAALIAQTGTSAGVDTKPAEAPKVKGKQLIGLRVSGVLVLSEAQGLVVSKIRPGSAADRSGLQMGDLIVAIAQQRTQDLAQAQRAIDSHYENNKSMIGFEVLRAGETRFFASKLENDGLTLIHSESQ